MKVCADGDSIAYKAAFSTQYQTYQIEGEDIVFRYMKDYKEWLALNFDKDEYPDVTKVQVLEPANHAFHIVNKIVESIKRDTDATELEIFLSGDTNFRKSVPYPVQYKGNRPEKPVLLPDIRNFLISRYNAKVTNGYEADDAIGIYATQNPGCIIASVDKDLRMIPGLHYHMDNKTITEVTELDGLRAFYKQMLIGDRVDNIVGVEGIGIKTAEKLIDKQFFEKDMDRLVRENYKECFKEDWERMYKSNIALLYILRSEEQYKELKEVYENTVSKSEGSEVATVGERHDTSSVQSS